MGVGPDKADPPDVFDEFFAAHRSDVLAYVVRRAPSSVVEDVLAETFIVAWRRWNEIPSDALPWLLGVARRVIANQRRGSERRVRLIDRLREQRQREPHWLAPTSLSPELTDVLSTLSTIELEALLLDAWEGLDSERAAIVLGCSPAAFRARLHRARSRAASRLTTRSAPHPTSVSYLESEQR